MAKCEKTYAQRSPTVTDSRPDQHTDCHEICTKDREVTFEHFNRRH